MEKLSEQRHAGLATAPRAKLSEASSQRGAEIVAGAFPCMAEEYLAGFPPVGAERPLEEGAASITRGGIAVLAVSLLAAWSLIGLTLVWLLPL